MKRKPEQIHKLNQLLDDVVEAGHIEVRGCTCRKCKALDKYSTKLGFRVSRHDSFAEQRALRTAQRHRSDAKIISKMITKGKTIDDIMKRIHHSRSYVHEIIHEFDLN